MSDEQPGVAGTPSEYMARDEPPPSEAAYIDVPKHLDPPFHRALDIKMRVGPDKEGIAYVDVNPEIHFGARFAHGGVVAAIVDIASAISIAIEFPRIRHSLEGTLEMKINYLRKVRDGDLTATARLTHLGRRSAVSECDVTNKGRLVAKALSTYMLAQEATDEVDRRRALDRPS